MWAIGQLTGAVDPRGYLFGRGLTPSPDGGGYRQGMGGDPPRTDYDQVATPQREPSRPAVAALPGVSAAGLQAAQRRSLAAAGGLVGGKACALLTWV